MNQSIRVFVLDLKAFSHNHISYKILGKLLECSLLPIISVMATNFFFTHGFLKLFHTYFLEGEKTLCRKQVLTKMPKVTLQHSANFFRQ